jgi:hypothetical protein
MAIIEKVAPNGKVIEFDTEQFNEQQIEQYLNLPEYQQQEEQKPVAKRNVVEDIAFGAVDGVRDGVQATIGLVDELGDTLGEKLNIGQFQFGEDAKNGFFGYKKFDELTEQEKIEREKDFIELPDFEDDPQTLAGGLTKGVSQFLTGWFTGGRILKGAKYVSKLGSLGQNVARGAVADFQAFDENTGRLADVINDKAPALSNPLFDYLASDADDGFYEARFKNALEGSVLGAGVDVSFRAFRYWKNKRAEIDKKPHNKKQLEEDEKFLSELEEDKIVVNKYVPKEEKFVKEVEKNLEANLSNKIFRGFQEAQKSSPNRKIFTKKILDLDLSLDFNVREFTELDKGGLLTLKAFQKATDKVIKESNIVFDDETIERTARKLYENNAGKLEIDVQDLQVMVRKAPAMVMAMNNYNQTIGNAIKRLAKLSKVDPKAKTLLTDVFIPRAYGMIKHKKAISKSIANSLRVSAKSTDGLFRDLENVLKDKEQLGGDIDETIRRLGLIGDADVTKIFKYASDNKTWDIANEIWINALLSNPKTHIINTTSNLMNIFVRPLEKAVGSRLGFAVIDGASRVKKLRAEGQRAISTYSAMRRYLGDSLKYAKMAMNREDTILTSRSKLETPKKAIQKTKQVRVRDENGNLVERSVEDYDTLSGKLINYGGKFVRIPSRFLNAEDEFFKQVVYRAELEKAVIDDAISKGLNKDKIIATDIKSRKPISEFEDFVARKFDEGFDEYGKATRKDILRKAEEGTYTNEVQGIFKRVSDTTNQYPILKQILPFTRTPVNLMLNVIDRTPLGAFRRKYRDDFMGRNGVERMAQARGQQATGFGLMLYASYLYRDGIITGSQGQVVGEDLVKGRSLKDLSKASGRQPYSFRYFDEEEQNYKYVNFGRFDPFGAFFGLVADYHTFYDKMTDDEIKRAGGDFLIMLDRMGGDADEYLSSTTKFKNALSAGGASVTRNIFSKTYLKGLADFMEALTSDDENKWSRYTQSKLGSFIPNVYTKLINDPFYRDVRGIVDEAKRRSAIGEEVEVKYDFRGNPLEVSGNSTERFINGLFNPFTTSTQKQDPVVDEILSLGINMPNINRTLNGDIDLTLFKNKKGQTAYNRQQEVLRKVRIGGKSLDQKLRETINSDLYKRLSDPLDVDENNRDEGQKVKLIKSIIKDYHTVAEEFLIKEATNFTSIKDDTGRYTLLNSIKAVNSNSEKLKMGLPVNASDLDTLYQFSK